MDVRRTLARLAGLSAAPVLALTACGGHSSSIADPPISSAPQSSAPTTPHPTTPQAAAKTFARRWAREDIKMQNTGKTTQFRMISQGCTDCRSLADRIDKIYAAGGYVKTRGWLVQRVTAERNGSGAYIVNLHVQASPTVYAERRGGPRQSYSGGHAIYQLGVRQATGHWNVFSLARLSS